MSPVLEAKCYQIDAFTKEAFGGNPAAVVLLPHTALPLSDSVRQKVAAEMNLSETAFVECIDDSDDFASCSSFRLRWFTPAIEVPLCGHATLATAAAIFNCEGNSATSLSFSTLSGELIVTRKGDGLLSMSLPLIEATAEGWPPDMGIGSALVQAAVGTLPVAEVLYDPSLRYLMVVLQHGSEETLQEFLRLQPNSQQLGAAHTGGQLVGVIVTLQGQSQVTDFYSRFFAPWAGISEDPVTGSAHSVLGSYWARKLGKQQLRARQCSKRGGELFVEVKRSEGVVLVAGSTVTVLKGALLLPKDEA